MDEEQYAETLSGPNMNREEYGTTATNVDDALSVLSFDGSEKEDRHPERYGHELTLHVAYLPPLCVAKPATSVQSLCLPLLLAVTTMLLCRRLKATHAAFAERELPKLKEDKPGLKKSQYSEMIFKMWQKSPENPMNKQNGS